MGFFSWLFKKNQVEPIKLGLALGSGGAKGFAELGVLKAFEENGIEFDIIAGTSIVSIIGAFYANGYSSTDIYELITRVDFSEVLSFLMINMSTAGLNRVIDRYIGHLTIEELKKPFRTVATERETYKEKLFSSGSVATALCASSAYPPFFKPVEIDGKKYIDGAFSNSIPANHVRDLGADFIVGVDLGNSEEQKDSAIKPWKQGYDNSDVMLVPNLKGFKAISFSRGSEMYDIGYQCAMAEIKTIKAKIEQVRLQKRKRK